MNHTNNYQQIRRKIKLFCATNNFNKINLQENKNKFFQSKLYNFFKQKNKRLRQAGKKNQEQN